MHLSYFSIYHCRLIRGNLCLGPALNFVLMFDVNKGMRSYPKGSNGAKLRQLCSARVGKGSAMRGDKG